MNVPANTPNGIPEWVLWFTIAASFILTILKIMEFLKKSKLDLVLTREFFFRILESGESIFTNAVLISYYSEVLIKDISATLSKKNGSIKAFKLEVSQIGEKYRTKDGYYQYSFHSSSPIMFIPKNNSQRLVYIWEDSTYTENVRKEFKNFRQSLLRIKENIPVEKYKTGFDESTTNEVERLMANTHLNIMENIQIEKGNYNFELEIKYRCERKLFPGFFDKIAKAEIQFQVEETAKESFKSSLKQYLDKIGYNLIYDQNEYIFFPSYTPINIKEIVIQ